MHDLFEQHGSINDELLREHVAGTVQRALAEDIGDGDITAALIPVERRAEARIVCRQQAVLCGRPWVEEVFHRLDTAIKLDWEYNDGESLAPGTVVFRATGPARALLTGERTALNFLQLLSGTATTAREYAERAGHGQIRILDTRKTIPGLRLAQKYAVRTGGCHNHRLGLYDVFLIKENHISACGGITLAVNEARRLYPGKLVEVEVENLAQLEEAVQAQAEVVMLDNFSLADIEAAVSLAGGKVKLEASGGYDPETVEALAGTGVDYISVGALTKHVRAVDFSMRIEKIS